MELIVENLAQTSFRFLQLAFALPDLIQQHLKVVSSGTTHFAGSVSLLRNDISSNFEVT
jgi:hypothetical protein